MLGKGCALFFEARDRFLFLFIAESWCLHSFGQTVTRWSHPDCGRRGVEYFHLGSEPGSVDHAQWHVDRRISSGSGWWQFQFVDIIDSFGDDCTADSLERRITIQSSSLLCIGHLSRRETMLQLLFRWKCTRLGHSKSKHCSVSDLQGKTWLSRNNGPCLSLDNFKGTPMVPAALTWLPMAYASGQEDWTTRFAAGMCVTVVNCNSSNSILKSFPSVTVRRVEIGWPSAWSKVWWMCWMSPRRNPRNIGWPRTKAASWHWNSLDRANGSYRPAKTANWWDGKHHMEPNYSK